MKQCFCLACMNFNCCPCNERDRLIEVRHSIRATGLNVLKRECNQSDSTVYVVEVSPVHRNSLSCTSECKEE